MNSILPSRNSDSTRGLLIRAWRQRVLRLGLLAVCLGGLAGSAKAADKGWKAGIAKAVITPEKGVWLAGYGSKRAPNGKLHDLWMKALALEDTAGRRVVLITSDFQGVPKGMSDQVFEQIRKKFGLERHQVMLTFSPIRWFIRVDLPTLGRPTMATTPQRVSLMLTAPTSPGPVPRPAARRGGGWRRWR